MDKTAILEKTDIKQISQVSLAGENKDMEVEVKVTIAQLPTTAAIDNMIQSGQVQTSVNGLTIQNGLTTNLVSAKAATGEEVPEQVEFFVILLHIKIRLSYSFFMKLFIV